MEMLILLVCAHALCDYPLQGDFLSKAKNNRQPIPGVPAWQAMSAHCAIHAGAVMLITGFWIFAVFEFVVHYVTDRAKCNGFIGYNQDQAIHVLCKAAYVPAVYLLTA